MTASAGGSSGTWRRDGTSIATASRRRSTTRCRRRRADQLVVLAGRVLNLSRNDGMTEVSFRRRGAAAAETLYVRRVINCTGPARDIRVGSSDLVQSLIARGIGRPGPLALGLDVDDSGALIGQDGRAQDRILAIGPLLKERLWETTAVRELRTQALDLARDLLESARTEEHVSGMTISLVRSMPLSGDGHFPAVELCADSLLHLSDSTDDDRPPPRGHYGPGRHGQRRGHLRQRSIGNVID